MILDPDLQGVIDSEWNNYYTPLTAYDEIEQLDVMVLIDVGCYSCGDLLDPESLYWFVREWYGWRIIEHYGISIFQIMIDKIKDEIYAIEDKRVFDELIKSLNNDLDLIISTVKKKIGN